MDRNRPRRSRVVAIGLLAGRQVGQRGDRRIERHDVPDVRRREIRLDRPVDTVRDAPFTRLEMDDLECRPSSVQDRLVDDGTEVIGESK